MGTVDVQVRTRVTKDRRDTFVNLDTPTPGWEVRKTNANRSNNDEGFTINTDIFLANPKEGLGGNLEPRFFWRSFGCARGNLCSDSTSA
jgi:hypothetical protein